MKLETSIIDKVEFLINRPEVSNEELYDLMSAIRGPDSANALYLHKLIFTTAIRGKLFTKHNVKVADYRHIESISALRSPNDVVDNLVAEALDIPDKSAYCHYIGHVFQALCVIAKYTKDNTNKDDITSRLKQMAGILLKTCGFDRDHVDKEELRKSLLEHWLAISTNISYSYIDNGTA